MNYNTPQRFMIYLAMPCIQWAIYFVEYDYSPNKGTCENSKQIKKTKLMVTKFSSLYLGPGLVICCLFILLSFLKNLPKTCIKCSFRVDYLSIGFLQRNLLKQSKNCKEHTYEHEHISHRFRCNKLIPTLP